MSKTDCKPIPPLTPSDIARFWKYVDVRGPDECWPWTGDTMTYGYGRLTINHRSIGSNRLAYLIVCGEDPAPLCVLHDCDNPPCCNPNHLFKGTKKENSQDMARKGRCGTAKISMEQAIQIRFLSSLGDISNRELAEKFGISRPEIGKILHGYFWNH